MSVLSRRLTSLLPKPITRGYGSAAAAAQLDYDYDYDVNPRGTVESNGWETIARGVQWVIMGDPMVRRYVYAERLANLLDVPHISMGSLLRQELNPRSPLYKKIAGPLNQGKLVPEDVIFGLLSKRLEEGYCRGETGFILDGIPRTKIQAEILDQIADIDLVLNLKCKEESVLKKTLEDGTYSPSQELHSMATSGLNLRLQPQAGHFKSSRAESDTIWKEKLNTFTEQRKSVEEYYRKQKKLLDFQVGGAPGDAWEGLLAALHLQHMNAVAPAVNSSQKLTA